MTIESHDGHAERVANTISRDPEQGTWPAEAEAQRQVADADRIITVRMEETCTFSLKFTVAKLAEHLGVAPTLKEVTEALDGANEDISPGDALVDVMEDGYDACTDRTITHEVVS